MYFTVAPQCPLHKGNLERIGQIYRSHNTNILLNDHLPLFITLHSLCCYTNPMSQKGESGKDELEPLKSVLQNCSLSAVMCSVDFPSTMSCPIQ